VSENLIKVHVTFENAAAKGVQGESLWARRISHDTAKIDNVPFFANMALGDLVRFDPNDPCNEIVEILEHVARTRMVAYLAPEEARTTPYEQIKERYGELRAKFQEYDIRTEGMQPGLMVISVPNDINDAQLRVLTDQMDCELFSPEENEDEAG
jgi:hypothetical protein